MSRKSQFLFCIFRYRSTTRVFGLHYFDYRLCCLRSEKYKDFELAHLSTAKYK